VAVERKPFAGQDWAGILAEDIPVDHRTVGNLVAGRPAGVAGDNSHPEALEEVQEVDNTGLEEAPVVFRRSSRWHS